MSDEPVDLDEHRGMMAQQATEVHRERIQEFQADQIALQRRQEELDRQLLAAPAGRLPPRRRI
ncbi:MAG: hypothetical protein ACRBM6_21125 [Geminicoccales bacterium]